jgi:hypothetical protein
VQVLTDPLLQSIAVVGLVLATVPEPAPTVYTLSAGKLLGFVGGTVLGSIIRLDVPTTSDAGEHLLAFVGRHWQLRLLD